MAAHPPTLSTTGRNTHQHGFTATQRYTNTPAHQHKQDHTSMAPHPPTPSARRAGDGITHQHGGTPSSTAVTHSMAAQRHTSAPAYHTVAPSARRMLSAVSHQRWNSRRTGDGKPPPAWRRTHQHCSTPAQRHTLAPTKQHHQHTITVAHPPARRPRQHTSTPAWHGSTPAHQHHQHSARRADGDTAHQHTTATPMIIGSTAALLQTRRYTHQHDGSPTTRRHSHQHGDHNQQHSITTARWCTHQNDGALARRHKDTPLWRFTHQTYYHGGISTTGRRRHSYGTVARPPARLSRRHTSSPARRPRRNHHQHGGTPTTHYHGGTISTTRRRRRTPAAHSPERRPRRQTSVAAHQHAHTRLAVHASSRRHTRKGLAAVATR